MNLIDFPRYVPLKEYINNIEKLVTHISTVPCSIIAIYQLGSIGDPGISDLDILVIFKNGEKYYNNPLGGLNGINKYLYMHSIFGMSMDHFLRSCKYFHFPPNKILYGEEIVKEYPELSHNEKKILNTQIALEYLIKQYITLTIQFKYGILKVRSLLLEIKAIRFDLELLGIKDHILNKLVSEMMIIRKNWFNNPMTKKDFINWIKTFYIELEKFLSIQLRKDSLMLPESNVYHFGSNIKILPATELKYKRFGINFPILDNLKFGRKLFNLHHRINSFEFYIPVKPLEANILAEKNSFEKECADYNLSHIPYFSPIRSSLILDK